MWPGRIAFPEGGELPCPMMSPITARTFSSWGTPFGRIGKHDIAPASSRRQSPRTTAHRGGSTGTTCCSCACPPPPRALIPTPADALGGWGGCPRSRLQKARQPCSGRTPCVPRRGGEQPLLRGQLPLYPHCRRLLRGGPPCPPSRAAGCAPSRQCWSPSRRSLGTRRPLPWERPTNGGSCPSSASSPRTAQPPPASRCSWCRRRTPSRPRTARNPPPIGSGRRCLQTPPPRRTQMPSLCTRPSPGTPRAAPS
mmetsp:Transcript_46656/g.113453  ORF Transcript_46656/g.113453 Transcript_46656/m.113453 type:complete len:253 (+) Transcript_46656:470-1228(+)